MNSAEREVNQKLEGVDPPAVHGNLAGERVAGTCNNPYPKG